MHPGFLCCVWSVRRPHIPSGAVDRVDEPWHARLVCSNCCSSCARSILGLVSDCSGEYVSGFVRCLWLFSCVSCCRGGRVSCSGGSCALGRLVGAPTIEKVNARQDGSGSGWKLTVVPSRSCGSTSRGSRVTPWCGCAELCRKAWEYRVNCIKVIRFWLRQLICPHMT